MITPQHSTQDGTPDDLLAKLRRRLDYRWREITEESAIDPAVALERGYYLEERKRGLERLGFKRSQQRTPAIVIPGLVRRESLSRPRSSPTNRESRKPTGSAGRS